MLGKTDDGCFHLIIHHLIINGIDETVERRFNVGIERILQIQIVRISQWELRLATSIMM